MFAAQCLNPMPSYIADIAAQPLSCRVVITRDVLPYREMLDTYNAQKRAGRFEASRPHTAGDRVKCLEHLMAQMRDLLMHGRAPAAYSPEDMRRPAPASYADEVAAQRASMEVLEQVALADASDNEPVGALHAQSCTFLSYPTPCCNGSYAVGCRLIYVQS